MHFLTVGAGTRMPWPPHVGIDISLSAYLAMELRTGITFLSQNSSLLLPSV
jgi:hypothetical protein